MNFENVSLVGSRAEQGLRERQGAIQFFTCELEKLSQGIYPQSSEISTDEIYNLVNKLGQQKAKEILEKYKNVSLTNVDLDEDLVFKLQELAESRVGDFEIRIRVNRRVEPISALNKIKNLIINNWGIILSIAISGTIAFFALENVNTRRNQDLRIVALRTEVASSAVYEPVLALYKKEGLISITPILDIGPIKKLNPKFEGLGIVNVEYGSVLSEEALDDIATVAANRANAKKERVSKLSPDYIRFFDKTQVGGLNDSQLVMLEVNLDYLKNKFKEIANKYRFKSETNFKDGPSYNNIGRIAFDGEKPPANLNAFLGELEGEFGASNIETVNGMVSVRVSK